MPFVIYDIASTMQMGPTPHGYPHSAYAKTYKTFGGAMRTANKWNAKPVMARVWNEEKKSSDYVEVYGPGPYGVASVETYTTKVVKMVEKTTIFGKKFTEASNTPGFCSPASEAYWSM